MSYKLKLTDKDNSIEIPLNTTNNSEIKLYDNLYYTIKLYKDENEIFDPELTVNGKKLDKNKNSPTFEGYFGYIRIGVALPDSGQLTSEYINVITHDEKTYEFVKEMIEYIYSHWNDFPNKNILEKLGYNIHNSLKNYTPESLLKSIADCYEDNLKLFFANSRTKIIDKQTVDRLERLKHFSSDTLKYIFTHPAQLIEQKTGISIDGKSYVPQKTLISANSTSLDVHENQVVLSFLKYIIDYLDNPKKWVFEEGEYILGACLHSAITKEEYEPLDCTKATDLKNKFKALYRKYRRIFPYVKKIRLNSLPPMTHVFKNIPHYNSIYRHIKLWFDGGGISSVNNEKLRWILMTSSEIYEYYVLLKLNEDIKTGGYELIQEKSEFPKFLYYQKGNCKKYLYYQPKIYYLEGHKGVYKDDDEDICLRRNTKKSFTSDTTSGTPPYTPDFIIKEVDASGKATYEIADAKFSTFETVREFYRPECGFKYLLSVESTTVNAKISGLTLYYCKGEEIDEYDRTIKEPFIKISNLK